MYEKACKHFATNSKYIRNLHKCGMLFNQPNWLQWKDDVIAEYDDVIAVPIMLPAKENNRA